jgi:hypothetical protein
MKYSNQFLHQDTAASHQTKIDQVEIDRTTPLQHVAGRRAAGRDVNGHNVAGHGTEDRN